MRDAPVKCSCLMASNGLRWSGAARSAKCWHQVTFQTGPPSLTATRMSGRQQVLPRLAEAYRNQADDIWWNFTKNGQAPWRALFHGCGQTSTFGVLIRSSRDQKGCGTGSIVSRAWWRCLACDHASRVTTFSCRIMRRFNLRAPSRPQDRFNPACMKERTELAASESVQTVRRIRQGGRRSWEARLISVAHQCRLFR